MALKLKNDIPYPFSDADDSADEKESPMISEQPIQQQQQQETIFSGFLKKKGERRRNWKRRWFVLRPSRLTYYKNESEYELRTIIELSDVHTIGPIQLVKRPFVFGLVTRSRTYYFQADSEDLKNQWISLLQAAHAHLSFPDLKNAGSFSPPSIPTAPINVSAGALYALNSNSAPSESSPLAIATNVYSSSQPKFTVSPSYMGSSPDDDFFIHIKEGKEFKSKHSASISIATTNSFLTTTTTPDIHESTTTKKTVMFQPQEHETLKTKIGSIQQTSSIYSQEIQNLSPAAIEEGLFSSDDEENEPPESATPCSENIDGVIKQGYVHKQSTKLGRQFKKRWFVLRNSFILTIYKSFHEYVALQIIPLNQVLDVLDIHSPNKSQPYCFKIVGTQREIVASADTLEEMSEWISVLKNAMRQSKEISE